MAQQTINRGTTQGDGTGDSGFVGTGKINDNFTENYTDIATNTETLRSNIPNKTIQTPNIDWTGNIQEYARIWTAVNSGNGPILISNNTTVVFRTKRITYTDFNSTDSYTVSIKTWREERKYTPTGSPTPNPTLGTGGNIVLSSANSLLNLINEEKYTVEDGVIVNGLIEDLGTVSSISTSVNNSASEYDVIQDEYLFIDDAGNEWVYNGEEEIIGNGSTTVDADFVLLVDTITTPEETPSGNEVKTFDNKDNPKFGADLLFKDSQFISLKKDDVLNAIKLIFQSPQYKTEFNVGGLTGTLPTSILSVPTPDFTGQFTHPDVLNIPEGFRDFKEWMGGTPYANANTDVENPCIWVKNSSGNWVVPPGITNPIEPTPATDYYADPDLLHTNGVLYYFYRYFSRSGGAGTPADEFYIEVQSLTETATAFTPKRRVITFTAGGGSPVIIPYYDKFYLFHIDFLPETGQPRKLYRLESDKPDSGYTNQVECNVNNIFSGKDLWHMDIVPINEQLVLIANNCATGTNGFEGVIQLGTSRDNGLNFDLSPNILFPEGQAGAFYSQYRTSGVYKFPNILELYVAGISQDRTEWNVGFTEIAMTGSQVAPPVAPTTLTYDNVSFTTNTLLTSPIDHFFNTDGTKLFLLGPATDSFAEHDLTIVGNISTVGNGTLYDVSAIESGLLGASISHDGTYVFTAGSDGTNHRIKRINLTTANTFSGGFTEDANSLNTSGIVDSPRSVCILSQGLRAIIATGVNGNYNIYQLNMSTAGDLSTVTHVKTVDLQSFFAGSTSGIADISKSVNEQYLYISDVGSQKIVSFEFGTLGEIDTLENDGEVVITEDTTPLSARFNTVGDKFTVNGFANKSLYQYTPPSNNRISLPADISAKEVVYVIDGDSLTEGINNAGEANDQYIGNQVSNNFSSLAQAFTLYSLGVSGASLQEKLVDVSTRVYPLAETGKDNILTAWLDANSIIQILSFSDGSTPDNSAKVNATTQYNDYVTYFNGATDFQTKILITGFMPRVDSNGDYKLTLPSGVVATIDPVSIDTLETFYDNIKNADISTVPWTHHIDLRDLQNIGGAKGQLIDNIYFNDYIHLQTAGYNEIVSKLNTYIHAILTD